MLVSAPVPSPSLSRLVVRYASRGWRWPIGPGDGLELWAGQAHLGTITQEVLVVVLLHHLQGAALTDTIRQALLTQLSAEPLVVPRPKRPLRGATRRLRGRKETPHA